MSITVSHGHGDTMLCVFGSYRKHRSAGICCITCIARAKCGVVRLGWEVHGVVGVKGMTCGELDGSGKETTVASGETAEDVGASSVPTTHERSGVMLVGLCLVFRNYPHRSTMQPCDLFTAPPT